MITFENCNWSRGWLHNSLFMIFFRLRLDYFYFKNYYRMILIDLSKQQALDTHPKAIQQISFSGNLEQTGNTTMFFIAEEAKETILVFHKELLEYCEFILF